MSMTLKTMKNLCCGLCTVFKIATRHSTVDVWKKSNTSSSWIKGTIGAPRHVRKIWEQPQPNLIEFNPQIFWWISQTTILDIEFENCTCTLKIGATSPGGHWVNRLIAHPVVRYTSPSNFNQQIGAKMMKWLQFYIPKNNIFWRYPCSLCF